MARLSWSLIALFCVHTTYAQIGTFQFVTNSGAQLQYGDTATWAAGLYLYSEVAGQPNALTAQITNQHNSVFQAVPVTITPTVGQCSYSNAEGSNNCASVSQCNIQSGQAGLCLFTVNYAIPAAEDGGLNDPACLTAGVTCHLQLTLTLTNAAQDPPTITGTSTQNPTAQGDVHLHLAYGGRADFRGVDNTVYNLLSAPSLAVNALFRESIYVATTKTARPLVVDGSWMTRAYVVARTIKGRLLNVTCWPDYYESKKPAASWIDATCGDERVRVTTDAYLCDNVHLLPLQPSGQLLVVAHEFTIGVRAGYIHRVSTDKGPTRRVDLSIVPHEGRNESIATGRVHGLVGQSFDGSNKPRYGATDEYPSSGVFRTKANAEGAIDGIETDYRVQGGGFGTRFRYSQF